MREERKKSVDRREMYNGHWGMGYPLPPSLFENKISSKKTIPAPFFLLHHV
jgi:hypothetical protein